MKTITRITLTVLIIAAIALGAISFTKNHTKKNETPTASPQQQVKNVNVEISVDSPTQVQKPAELKSITIEQGKTAWDALQKATGVQNIEFKDYGGDLGIFISAINGIKPTGNKFWLFKINGQGSDVGVSSYKVKSGDKLQ